MSRKTLNAANLERLGAERLAALLMEVSTGNAEAKRRLRLELSHALGADDLAGEVRKRLASIRKSKSWVSWRRRKALVKDLQTQLDMIEGKLAPDAPAEAFELLWQMVEMAPFVLARVDDSRGEVGAVFEAAIAGFAPLAPQALPDPQGLAERCWAMLTSDIGGMSAQLVPHLAPALGDTGLRHLRALVQGGSETVSSGNDDHAALQFLRELRGGRQSAETLLKRRTLRQIADAMGDVDGYIAQFSPRHLLHPDTASDCATRLLDAARPEDALGLLEDANSDGSAEGHEGWDAAYLAALDATGQGEAAQAYRWRSFEQRLRVEHLRAYLSQLPDFEDIEAEDRAMGHVQAHADATLALEFLSKWPDLARAADLVAARYSQLDGELHTLLDPAADRLQDRFPLAAALVRRAVIEFDLDYGRTFRYGATLQQLAECQSADAMIASYEGFESHNDFLTRLRQDHGRKVSFWEKYSA